MRLVKRHHMFRPGDLIDGRYEIVGIMAAGGMAEVYEATDRISQRRVAVKTPNLKYSDDPKIVARMVREGKSLAKLKHRNLVAVFDAGTHQGQFFIVMPYLEGFTLGKLANKRPLPVGVVLSTLRQIAKGLHALHEAGTVHRDVKPENVFMCEAPDEEEMHALMLDLGVAKIFGASTTSEGLTLGTPSYMSPEQTLGQAIDARTDIYSTGLLGFELLTGMHALEVEGEAHTAEEWSARQRNVLPPRIESVATHLDALVGNLIAKMIAKQPRQRFDSAAELDVQITSVMNALRHKGVLGPLRLERFEPQRDEPREESGPQRVAKVRPAGTETPSRGLPYRRTEQEEVTPEPPVALRAETPRVAPAFDIKTARGTTPMLGPRGTKPHLGPAPVPVPEYLKKVPSPSPPPPEVAAPTKTGPAGTPIMGVDAVPAEPQRREPIVTAPAALREALAESADTSSPRWQSVPRDQEKISRQREDAADTLRDSASPRVAAVSRPRGTNPLVATVFGLGLALLGIAIGALWVLSQERRLPAVAPATAETTASTQAANAAAEAPSLATSVSTALVTMASVEVAPVKPAGGSARPRSSSVTVMSTASAPIVASSSAPRPLPKVQTAASSPPATTSAPRSPWFADKVEPQPSAPKSRNPKEPDLFFKSAPPPQNELPFPPPKGAGNP